MDVKAAATSTLALAEQHFHDNCSTSGSLNYGPEKANILHLRHMNQQIQRGVVRDDKAHRWLGWMQAVVYLAGAATHAEVQRINKES